MTTTKKSLAVLTLTSLVFAGFTLSAAAKKGGNSSTARKRVFNSVIVENKTYAPNTITATIGSTTYTVNAANAKLLRRDNKSTSFFRIGIGDNIKIWGTIDSVTPNTINATIIRDNSIQKLGSSLKGTIKAGSLNSISNVFTLVTSKRGENMVEVGTAKIVYRGASKIFTDLHEGDTVEVIGIWNSHLHILYDVTRIKVAHLAPTI